MSNLSITTRIAFRYFLQGKWSSATTIISVLSGIGISIGTASLIICLSVFNGFQDLILERYNAIYPDYVVKPLTSKHLQHTDDIVSMLRNEDGKLVCCKVIVENAYIKYGNSDYILKVYGVDTTFLRYSNLKEYVSKQSKQIDLSSILLSEATTDALDISYDHVMYPVQILIPKVGKGLVSPNPQNSFLSEYVQVGQRFSINPEVDQSVAFVGIEILDGLLNILPNSSMIYVYSKQLTAKKLREINEELKIKFEAKIESRLEQNVSLYRILNIEKLTLVLIIAFIIFIISFSLFGSISILAIEKKQNFFTLMSLGLSSSDNSRILFLLAASIILVAICLGNVFGLLICFLQLQFGFVKLGGLNTFIIDAYPVSIHLRDVMYTDLVVFIVSFISILPIRKVKIS